MLEPFVYQMAIPCSSYHCRVAIAVCLVLLFIFWSCCSTHLTSTFLTFSVLLLSTSSLPFFLPRIRHLGKADSMEKPSETDAGVPQQEDFVDMKVTAEELLATFHTDEAVAGSEECEILETSENSSRSASQCSNFDDESSPEDACRSTESSEDAISDDENLIEISLPDGHFVAPKEPKALLKPLPDTRRGLILTNLLPESVLMQHGLMELLSEINEEDNLIEIDITRGSIKYSRVGIKA